MKRHATLALFAFSAWGFGSSAAWAVVHGDDIGDQDFPPIAPTVASPPLLNSDEEQALVDFFKQFTYVINKGLLKNN
jgi:hypothetical protein